MKTYTPEMIQETLRLHALWLSGDPGGVKADFRNADLRDAALSGVNLRGTDVRCTDLRDADLRGADMRGVDLRDADLSYADLSGTDLSRADLRGANMSYADVRVVDLHYADLRDVNLCGADLNRADLSGCTLPEGVPVVPNIDRRILDAIERGGELNMFLWHTCETTHCRAGWAIVLAGEAGKALEEKWGTSVAGALIYAASRPGMPVPNWYSLNEDALEDIRKCAAMYT